MRVWPLTTDTVPYLSVHLPPSQLPPFQVSLCQKRFGICGKLQGSGESLASSTDLQAQQSEYLPSQCEFILEALTDTQPHSSLESLHTLCQFRWGFFLCPFPPALSPAGASPERCLAPSHTSRAGIRSGARSLFFMGISLAATGPLELTAETSPPVWFSQPLIAPGCQTKPEAPPGDISLQAMLFEPV